MPSCTVFWLAYRKTVKIEQISNPRLFDMHTNVRPNARSEWFQMDTIGYLRRCLQSARNSQSGHWKMDNDRFTVTKSNINNHARANFFSPFSYQYVRPNIIANINFHTRDSIVLRAIHHSYWPKGASAGNVLYTTIRLSDFILIFALLLRSAQINFMVVRGS